MVVSLRNDFVQFLMLPFHICNIVMLGFYIIDLQIKLQLLFYHIFKYSKATFFPWGYRSAKSSLSVQVSSNSLSDCRVLNRVRCHSKKQCILQSLVSFTYLLTRKPDETMLHLDLLWVAITFSFKFDIFGQINRTVIYLLQDLCIAFRPSSHTSTKSYHPASQTFNKSLSNPILKLFVIIILIFILM